MSLNEVPYPKTSLQVIVHTEAHDDCCGLLYTQLPVHWDKVCNRCHIRETSLAPTGPFLFASTFFSLNLKRKSLSYAPGSILVMPTDLPQCSYLDQTSPALELRSCLMTLILKLGHVVRGHIQNDFFSLTYLLMPILFIK